MGRKMEPSELIEEHLDLVRRIVAQVAVRFPRHVDRAELARAGDLGLVEAARRFDASRGVPFRRFASARIRGAMIDSVRATDWAPRSVRASARDLTHAEQVLAGGRGRVPSTAELAAALAVTPADVAEVRSNAARSVVFALDHTPPGGGGHGIGDMLADRTAVEPGEAIESRELLGYLRDAVGLLPERHRAVVVGYFIEGRTSRGLADELGVTESRVSQLRSEALTMLRDGIGAQYRGDTGAMGGGGESWGPRMGRVARRRDSYATAIGRASTWRHRLTEAADRPDRNGPLRTLEASRLRDSSAAQTRPARASKGTGGRMAYPGPQAYPSAETRPAGPARGDRAGAGDQASAPAKTAALTPRRASSTRTGTASASSPRPPAPNRSSRPAAAQRQATAATVPAATAGRSMAP